MFKANFTDYMRSEKSGYEIYRPNGTGDYLFLYFPYPMRFFTPKDEFTTQPHACIVFKPDEFQHFTDCNKFCNSFVHFSSDRDITAEFSFPTNHVFYPVDVSEINTIIYKIKNEKLLEMVKSEDMINMYITSLLVLIERTFKAKTKDELYHKFLKLRANMLTEYNRKISIEDLASSVCMSKSRFYDYYRKYFNASPKHELLKMRMDAARTMLANRALSVSEIAHSVGFENVEHFTRSYKKHFGVSPRYFCRIKSDKTSKG